MIDDQGWCDSDDFEDPVQEGVESQLGFGETLLWSERPILPRMRRIRPIPALFVFVLTTLSGVSLAALLGVFEQPRVTVATVLIGFCLAPVALGGLIALDAARRAAGWLSTRWTLARTVYAVTDQRVIIGQYDSRDRRLTVDSLIPGMIAGTSRYENADGTGDLYFEGMGALAKGPVGFFGIRHVRQVDRLLHETLIDPFPRW